jgi:hypothetical protein
LFNFFFFFSSFHPHLYPGSADAPLGIHGLPLASLLKIPVKR